MGGRTVGGLEGRSHPKNLRWGTAHASVSPIFGEVVLSQVHVRTEKTDILGQNRRFCQEKSDIYVLHIIDEIHVYEIMLDSRDRGKDRKKSMTLKRSSEIVGVKMEIFSLKKVIRKFFRGKCFQSPPNSEPGLRLWARAQCQMTVEVL